MKDDDAKQRVQAIIDEHGRRGAARLLKRHHSTLQRFAQGEPVLEVTALAIRQRLATLARRGHSR